MAEAARQKGLEPLATILLLQRENNLAVRASSFVKGDVKDIDDALKGARDIIAEQVNEDEHARNAVRNQFGRQAEIIAKVVKGKEDEAAKYRDYFDFSESLKRCTENDEEITIIKNGRFVLAGTEALNEVFED